MYDNDPKSVLCHFNPNHDPRNGQFVKSPIGQKVTRHLEKKIEKSDLKRTNKLQKLSEMESRAERRAYSPLSSYGRAERILGEQLRKKARKSVFKADKIARTGANAYAKLLKIKHINDIDTKTIERGEKLLAVLMQSIGDLKTATFYKSLAKEYNTVIDFPFTPTSEVLRKME